MGLILLAFAIVSLPPLLAVVVVTRAFQLVFLLRVSRLQHEWRHETTTRRAASRRAVGHALVLVLVVMLVGCISCLSPFALWALQERPTRAHYADAQSQPLDEQIHNARRRGPA